jgi:hypothetical protein
VFGRIPDSTDLLNAVKLNFWWGVILDKDVVAPVFVGFPFAESELFVFDIVADTVVFPCDRATRVLFVDSVTVAVVVVAFAVARWVVLSVVGAEPRTEGFRELFENFLAGLTVQSSVFGVVFQFVFEVFFVRNFTGFVPHLSSVVVGDVPEFGCQPAVFAKRTNHLRVVADAADIGSACGRHPYTQL